LPGAPPRGKRDVNEHMTLPPPLRVYDTVAKCPLERAAEYLPCTAPADVIHATAGFHAFTIPEGHISAVKKSNVAVRRCRQRHRRGSHPARRTEQRIVQRLDQQGGRGRQLPPASCPAAGPAGTPRRPAPPAGQPPPRRPR